ncbi:hypothetical protein [Methylobacterium sp. DCY52]|jgi:hypothetical protein|uniref:hypothetical protein n=1 Tax=Methylobacterium sp. DCY52 TaxID=739139 RepID=UPI003145698B
MIKTMSLAAFLAASAFALAPLAASAQAIEVGPGGVGVHGDHHGDDAHHAPVVEHRVVEDTHGDHGGGHAEERHETSHGDTEHH